VTTQHQPQFIYTHTSSTRWTKIGFSKLFTRNNLSALLYSISIIPLAALLFACTSAPSSNTVRESDQQSTNTATAKTSSQEQTTTTPAPPTTKSTKKQLESEAQQAKSPQTIASCQQETYIKDEQQARESIKKGLAATNAGKFGVGFRNTEEYQKWNEIHNMLFKKVADACASFSNCIRASKKDKNTECSQHAKIFQNWQAITKSFAAKAKTAETTQPPIICSSKPNITDAPRCFHGLAENIERDCNTAKCKEVSQCWHGVAFLDDVITQAVQSCGFVHQALSQCRSYQEATSRRENKFTKCEKLQDNLTTISYPVL